jgi:hypothetical protein
MLEARADSAVDAARILAAKWAWDSKAAPS